MKKIWMPIVAIILLFFAAVLLTVGTLITLDARKNTAPARREPGLYYISLL